MNDEKPKETLPALSTMPMAPSTGGLQLVPQSFNEVLRLADLMSGTGVAVRKQFRGDTGACLMLCQQALRWEMDPFAVANKAYIVNDQIAYEAQLIAAVVHTRAGLEKLPTYEFDGEGEALTCTVTATRKDGVAVSYTSPALGDIKIKNSPLWKTDTPQQLGYFSIRAWARRYTPEVILGVYDPDEAAQMKDITPEADRAEMSKGLPGQTKEGFSPAVEVAFEEVDPETGEVAPEPDTSDIPEASEEFFKNAEIVQPGEKRTKKEPETEPGEGDPVIEYEDKGRSIGDTEPDHEKQAYEQDLRDEGSTVATDLQEESKVAVDEENEATQEVLERESARNAAAVKEKDAKSATVALLPDGDAPDASAVEGDTQADQAPDEPPEEPEPPKEEAPADNPSNKLPADNVELGKAIHNDLRQCKTMKALKNMWNNSFKEGVASRKGTARDALESIFMNHEDRVRGTCDAETCKQATLHQLDRIKGNLP